MKRTKALLALLLALVLVCTALPLTFAADGDATIYGTAGDLVWTLDNKGVLTINGEGAMPNFDYWNGSTYYYDSSDWSAYRGSITKVVIKDGVTSISQNAFRDCTSLTTVTIPNSVTSIGSYAFYYCSALPTVTIPDSVTSIGYDAFQDCDALTSITIPDSVKEFGNGAFAGCNRLASVTIGNSVTSIGDSAFSGCNSLTSVTIPDSVTSIGDYAFYDCDALTSITIPDSVKTIGYDAFYDCYRLASVTIGSGVTSIGSYAFYCCYNLSRVDITDLDAWCRISFGSAAANPLYYGKNLYLNGELLETVDVTEGISTINAYAFYNCESIKNVTLPITVGSIGPDAFYGYTGTKTQWNGNEYVDVDVPYGCKNLESVTILNGLCTIADSATTISPTATIISYDNTEAQAYAEKYNRTFVSLGEYTHEHTPVIHEEPGNCKTKGYRLTTCAVCGEQIAFEYLGYGEHQYGEWCIDCNATCLNAGKKYRSCSVCWNTEWETIPALGHIDENNDGICERCGQSTSGTTDPIHYHTFADTPDVPAVVPTCTTDGHGAGFTCQGGCG